MSPLDANAEMNDGTIPSFRSQVTVEISGKYNCSNYTKVVQMMKITLNF